MKGFNKIEKLASMWRKAEDNFQETEDDKQKLEVLEYQKKLNLTTSEEKELNDILQSMGV